MPKTSDTDKILRRCIRTNTPAEHTRTLDRDKKGKIVGHTYVCDECGLESYWPVAFSS